MRVLLLPLYIRNKNNRIYTEDSFIQPFKYEYLVELSELIDGKSLPYDYYIPLERVVAVIRDIKCINQQLTGDMTMLNVPNALGIEQQYKSDALVIRPISQAKIKEETGLVIEANIVGFQFCYSETDSYNLDSNCKILH